MAFQFEQDLSYGMSGSDVLRLQQELQLQSCFGAEPTGYFGSITREAVICFQTKNNFSPIPPTGYVGPYTRQALNQIIAAREASSSPTPAPNPAPAPAPAPEAVLPAPAPAPTPAPAPPQPVAPSEPTSVVAAPVSPPLAPTPAPLNSTAIILLSLLLAAAALTVYFLIKKPRFFFARRVKGDVKETESLPVALKQEAFKETEAFKSAYVTPEVVYNSSAATAKPAKKSRVFPIIFSRPEKAAPVPDTVTRPPIQLATWKTVLLDSKIDPESINIIPKENSFGLGEFYNLIGKEASDVHVSGAEAKLVAPTVADLGFEGSASYQDIRARAKELGLSDCPAGAVLQLRSEYSDQPNGEMLLIGMEPVRNSTGGFYIFSLESQNDRRILTTVDGNPQKIYPPGQRVVFVQSQTK